LINGLPRLHAFDVVSFSLRPVKSDGIGRYVFEENDLDLLSKFRTRTVLTITTDRIREVYQNHIIEIAPYVRTPRFCPETHSYEISTAPILDAQPFGVDNDA
jgi:hypothetical protein